MTGLMARSIHGFDAPLLLSGHGPRLSPWVRRSIIIGGLVVVALVLFSNAASADERGNPDQSSNRADQSSSRGAIQVSRTDQASSAQASRTGSNTSQSRIVGPVVKGTVQGVGDLLSDLASGGTSAGTPGHGSETKSQATRITVTRTGPAKAAKTPPAKATHGSPAKAPKKAATKSAPSPVKVPTATVEPQRAPSSSASPAHSTPSDHSTTQKHHASQSSSPLNVQQVLPSITSSVEGVADVVSSTIGLSAPPKSSATSSSSMQSHPVATSPSSTAAPTAGYGQSVMSAPGDGVRTSKVDTAVVSTSHNEPAPGVLALLLGTGSTSEAPEAKQPLPVVGQVVAPVMDGVVAPLVGEEAAAVVDGVVAPVVAHVVAPAVDDVAGPIVGQVVAPVTQELVWPVVRAATPQGASILPMVWIEGQGKGLQVQPTMIDPAGQLTVHQVPIDASGVLTPVLTGGLPLSPAPLPATWTSPVAHDAHFAHDGHGAANVTVGQRDAVTHTAGPATATSSGPSDVPAGPASPASGSSAPGAPSSAGAAGASLVGCLDDDFGLQDLTRGPRRAPSADGVPGGPCSGPGLFPD